MSETTTARVARNVRVDQRYHPIAAIIEFECPPEHEHAATDRCRRRHGCQCASCAASWPLSQKDRRWLYLSGRREQPFCDSAPAREHAQRLIELGMNPHLIATAAGVPFDCVYDLVAGRVRRTDGTRYETKRILSRNATAILNVTVQSAVDAPEGLVSARGAVRRIQALMAIGWSTPKIGARLGTTGQHVHLTLSSDLITVRRHRAIAAVFDELWDKRPEATTRWERTALSRTIAFASARGWAKPLDWDDIDTDPRPPAVDTETAVDDIAIELAATGHPVILTRDERQIAVRRLHAQRWSDALIAKTVGCSQRTVERDRDELGLDAFDQNDLVDVA